MTDFVGNESVSERFAQFDEGMFCDWLARGFKSFYLKAQGHSTSTTSITNRPDDSLGQGRPPRPFDFASHFIGRKESLLDDLEFIYTRLIPEDRRMGFRLSLGRLLRQSVNDDLFPEPAVSDLVYLMWKVRAYESLEAIAPVVARGKYGRDKTWLQYEAIAALKALLPAKESIEALRDLATQEHFQNSYCFDVLISLCRADPGNWSASFDLLRGHIANLREQARQKGVDALAEVDQEGRRFVQMFTKSLPTNEIARQVPPLTMTRSPHEVLNSGMWFVRALFTGDEPPIRILHDDSLIADDLSRVDVPIEVTRQPVRRVHMVCSADEYRVLFTLDRDLSREALLLPLEDALSKTRPLPLVRTGMGIRGKLRYIFSRKRSAKLHSAKIEGVSVDG